jgi:hypothetical protein
MNKKTNQMKQKFFAKYRVLGYVFQTFGYAFENLEYAFENFGYAFENLECVSENPKAGYFEVKKSKCNIKYMYC